MRYIPTPWRDRYVRSTLKTKGCALCQALRMGDDRSAGILDRGTYHFVILNKYPYTTGHLMIAPYRHSAAIERSSPASAAEMASMLQSAIRVLSAHYNPQGFNAGMNLGRCAGAGIADHYHLHVIPRWTGDANFLPLVGGTKVMTEDLATTYDCLRPLFEKERKRRIPRTRQAKNPSHSR